MPRIEFDWVEQVTPAPPFEQYFSDIVPRVGDKIEFEGDEAEYEYTVERVTWRLVPGGADVQLFVR